MNSLDVIFHKGHFAAQVLKAAGLDITPWWAFSEKLIAAQLDNLANESPQPEPTNQALRPIPVLQILGRHSFAREELIAETQNQLQHSEDK